MTALSNGGQAFPNPHYEDDEMQGMSLRDYFAAKAMHAILSDDNHPLPYADVAKHAYRMADEMLRAREKP